MKSVIVGHTETVLKVYYTYSKVLHFTMRSLKLAINLTLEPDSGHSQSLVEATR